MHARMTQALMAVAALSAAILTTETASAQRGQRQSVIRPRYQEPDTARLRYGVAAEVGGLFVPDVVGLSIFGLQGQVGVQLDDRVGVYVAPSFDFVRGDARGIHLGGALMIDWTFDDVFTVGIGPDVAAFAALAHGGLSGGVLYGVRFQMAAQPVVYLAGNGIRRDALTIGADLRLYTGGGSGVVSPRRIASSDLVVAPMLVIGYRSF